MRNLKSSTAIKMKALLFLILGLFSAGLLLARAPSVEVLVLLGLTVWSFCRMYYFAFYVVATYLDTTYKYSGLISLLRHATAQKGLKNKLS